MRITQFRIENFKSIRLAECVDPPDFMVICGSNGSGKSALLSALAVAKESAGTYAGIGPQVASISADAESFNIQMTLAFDEVEQRFLRAPPTTRNFAHIDPFHGSTSTITVTCSRHTSEVPPVAECPAAVRQLLASFSRQPNAPGFFDHIDAHRVYPRIKLSMWESNWSDDLMAQSTLIVPQFEPGLHSPSHNNKFQMTKRHLTSLTFRDLQNLQRSIRDGMPTDTDSLAEFRNLFNKFLSPLRFLHVDINQNPFQFLVATPMGNIDLDDLSSGEKEILNVIVRLLQLQPSRSVILFDEADAHLHPDLQRRYVALLKTFAAHNQVWITTHSPEMMTAAGSNHLFALTKVSQTASSRNQFLKVSHNDEMHAAMTEVMGTRGVVTFNQKVVFIEGDESSADIAIYEGFYPPAAHNLRFVPVGNSGTARKTAERVNQILTHATGFQSFFSIVDRDIDRCEPDPTSGERLIRLPVYHIENFLLNEQDILNATRSLLGPRCPFTDAGNVRNRLIECLFDDQHFKPFTRALLDAKLAAYAKKASDDVYSGQQATAAGTERPTYPLVEEAAKAVLTESITTGEWRERCKGRDLLKAYCKPLSLRYEHFRNILIGNLKEPPDKLHRLMKRILS